MPATAQPNLGLKQGYSDLEDGWGSDMNANLRALDLLVQARVIDKDLSTPPASPTDGDAYIVGASPVGAWASNAGKVARYRAASAGTGAAAWEFFAPKAGWSVWVIDEAVFYRYSGSAWVARPDATTSVVSINNQTGTTYTLALSDAGLVVRQSNAAAITTTVPPNSSVAFPVGSVVSVRQVGAGQVTVAAGVTLNVPSGYVAKTGRQGSVLMLHQVATDVWDLTGDFATS